MHIEERLLDPFAQSLDKLHYTIEVLCGSRVREVHEGESGCPSPPICCGRSRQYGTDLLLAMPSDAAFDDTAQLTREDLAVDKATRL